jgi:hypothetical protein
MATGKPGPPRWADKLLELFCAPHLLEQVIARRTVSRNKAFTSINAMGLS